MQTTYFYLYKKAAYIKYNRELTIYLNFQTKTMREISKLIAVIIFMISVSHAGFAKDYSSSAENRQNLSVQQKQINGTVTDSKTGVTLIGVTVVIEGTINNTITDKDGKFSISVPDSNSKLVFTYIGYEKQVVPVAGITNLDIKMVENIAIFNEVVVVGYGTVKKSDVTGSIAQVKSDQIQNTASSQIATALQGKVSGVYIMKNSGKAGAGVDVQIRGITSLNNVSPLWIIDGVPGDQNTVTMNDIETIDIIKDGTAAAIYGVKAAAGVVLVTTKRGLGQKKPKISFNAYSGISEAWRLPEMVNSDQYITLKNEQWAGKTIPVGFSLDSLGKYNTTNWMNEMFKRGQTQNYDINISGSNETSNYYLGSTIYKEEPSFVDNSLEKYSVRINSDYKIAKWLKIGESLSMLYSKLNGVADEGRYLDGIFRTPPMMPVYDENNQPGGFGFVDYRSLGDFDGGNPMADQLTSQGLSYHQQVNGNAYAAITILPGLKVTSTFSGNFSFDNGKTVTLPYKLSDRKNFSTTDISLGFSKGWNMLGNIYANYVKDFGAHNINLTAGYEASKSAGCNLFGNGTNAKFGLTTLDQTDVIGRTTGGGEGLGRFASLFGRATYQYANKYVLQAVVRRDGSDKFGPENRYGVFPSISGAWKISEENFLKENKTISFLKLRGGYGINGNDNIGQFRYASYMVNGNAYPYGTYSTVTQNPSIRVSSNFFNPGILWERSKQLDLGVELGLFKNALFITTEVYKKSSDQMLFYKGLPFSSGRGNQYDDNPSQVINAGLISNKGIDFAVTYKGNLSEFKYSVSANISTYRYTVDKLTDNNPLMTSSVLADQVQVSRTTVGESGGYFYGYQCDGIFQSQDQVDEYNNKARQRAKELDPTISDSKLEQIYFNSPKTAPGDLIYRDLNNDGIISQADRGKIGSPWPKATYGFQITADYKWFDLMITTAGIQGRSVFNAGKVRTYQFSSYDYSTSTDAMSRWTPENHSTTNYRIFGDDPNKNMSNPSSWYIEDGSFFRVKNIELGFTLPKAWTNKVGMDRFRLYVSGQNILTFTKYTGFDPEFGVGSATSAGVDNGSYPQSKVYLIGVQVDI
jgi:TonB-linked SusC/RagA family outer membrane protein